MKNEIVTVFGGSGFLGRHVVRALARRGYRIRIAVRRPELAEHLKPLGLVGQIYTIQANVRDDASVRQAIAGASAVVNCVGILFETGRQKFDALLIDGETRIAHASNEYHVKNLVQISAIGANEKSIAHYARANAQGEKRVRRIFPQATILRLSLLFGPEDDFFNKFAAMARYLPFLPLIGGGKTRFQPVFVDDVAEAVALCIEGRAKSGITYELGGPEIKTFRELMETMLHEIRRKRLLVPMPFWLARIKAAFLQLLPKPLLTVDQVRMFEADYTVSAQAISENCTLEGLGIAPTPLQTVLPGYLWPYRKGGQFAEKIQNITHS